MQLNKCAIQYTVDLNNNINRNVQEECPNRLYRYVHIILGLESVYETGFVLRSLMA